jgi:replication factor C large subunit
MDWTEGHRPETLQDLRGNDEAARKLREWAQTWEDHREAVVLHGSPGVGKTSAAHALANEMGWETIELNASDQRTGDVIERVAGEAAASGTLTGSIEESQHRLVILDEADNLSRHQDRGGTRAMTKVVKSANQPVILIGNDYYGMSNGLRNNAQDIEFGDLRKDSIVAALRHICREEGIEFEEAALEYIAAETNGDLRSAINDLQAVAEDREVLTEEDVVTGERDREEDIFTFLQDLLQTAGAQEALRQSYDVDDTPDDLIGWIEDNVPKEYDGEELTTAYEFLGNADKWLGRVYATQNYGYWRYAGDNMTAGVAAAREGRKGGWTRYGFPSHWRRRGGGSKLDDVVRRIADRSGTSIGTAREEILPRLQLMTHHCKPRELTVEMAAAYDLDAADVSAITGSGETTNKVQDVVNDAEALQAEAATAGADALFAPSDGEAAAEDTATDAGDEGTTTLVDAAGGSDSNADSDDSAAGTGDDDSDSKADRNERAKNDDGQAGLGDFG